ncbi:phosphatase PAP2 family protein [Pseudoduganella namucuonensis]|uniref:Autotransporter-associated beta strand repeat-containing protein n=1 Tax=Pseudoduganella namucuonensis TaxID=1035707 RepID=A0A1I7L5B1_9BURK|nr:phosphatase PAP2 family protein [Pseudoduganella namucuonensis]SFV04818.1 autotransporter-associated beta strand repeat-containing protein [Pseudoduganella namucuonensis]
MQELNPLRRLPLTLAISAILALTACGSTDHSIEQPSIPAPPPDQGAADTAPVAAVPAFVDNVATNQRGDARYATAATNAGVRVLIGMLDIWKPLTEIVDAGVTAPAVGDFPAVTASTWTGVPNDGTPGGTIVNAGVHNANIDYVVKATAGRTPAQELAAYLDDRRGKGYSLTDGMGPLTEAWRGAARQTTSITGVPADATTVLYNDSGNNTGVAGGANAEFGTVVTLVNAMGNNGSTEPAKRFFKYARPYRWSASVAVLPALVPAKSAAPGTDGGFTSGHSAEAVRGALGMAYALPERYQEIITRGLELGENRILSGMHSPLDVISGRVQAQAVAAANLADPANAATKAAAVAQAHAALMARTGTTAANFHDFAHSGTAANDRFSDHASNKAAYLRRLTFGFAPTGATTAAAVVPKGAEVLLETRLPYLSDVQRRVVLKTTALPSGYPLLDDAEGWGRLNLFAAADGYGAFTGNVVVAMDAAKGGYHAVDHWRNDISGTGKLVKQGTGALKLGGNNTWSGGTQLEAGRLEGSASTAFGKGDVYVGGGTLVGSAGSGLALAGKYTQLATGNLELKLGGAQQGRMTVAGVMTVAGGALAIGFQNGYKPAAGDTLHVIAAAGLKGRFDTITVSGFKAEAVYTDTGLQLRLSN